MGRFGTIQLIIMGFPKDWKKSPIWSGNSATESKPSWGKNLVQNIPMK